MSLPLPGSVTAIRNLEKSLGVFAFLVRFQLITPKLKIKMREKKTFRILRGLLNFVLLPSADKSQATLSVTRVDDRKFRAIPPCKNI